MGFTFSSIPKLLKDSAALGSAILAIIATFMQVAGFSIDNIICNQKWWSRLLIILATYAFLVVFFVIILRLAVQNGFTTKIRGISVTIKQGDIFTADGWKVIPFNEYFDTTVDDVIISSTTLNGIFINEYIDDINKLQEAIITANESYTSFKKYEKGNRSAYPLGRIITYGNYMLLAFTHFNEQNVAHITKPEYEKCLLTMWKEIRRTYANKPIYLPLLGSGITSFDDIPEKSNLDLLKCMICTLRASGENINQPITILLTKEVMHELNIYEVKGVI
ncbi:MAG: DUF6430 domain-containing protein [Sporomusaceae bacterium]|nr:DUF6430 domain-containing protein [Sporomusaceae bacterium]